MLTSHRKLGRVRFRRGPFALALVGAAALMVACSGPVGDADVPASAEVTDAPSAPAVGVLAPDFTLQTPEGETYALSDLRGRPVLVNFWATWCAPCRLEIPAIQAAYQAGELVVLAVDNTENDSVDAVVTFGEEFGLTFPLLLDPDSEVHRLYGIRAQPSSFFVDAEGVIRVVHFGAMTEEQLDSYIDDLLQ